MKYTVEQVTLCEVRIWGVIEAASMAEAMGRASSAGSAAGTSNANYSYEITSDIKTLSVEIREVA